MKRALTLSLIPLALFIALSMPNYARDSLATVVAVEYDSRVATLDRHIHAMMRHSAVVSYRKFNHNMKKVEESLLVARVRIMHGMRKSLDHLEDLVFEEPFIQTSQYNVIELQSRNCDILMPKKTNATNATCAKIDAWKISTHAATNRRSPREYSLDSIIISMTGSIAEAQTVYSLFLSTNHPHTPASGNTDIATSSAIMRHGETPRSASSAMSKHSHMTKEGVDLTSTTRTLVIRFRACNRRSSGLVISNTQPAPAAATSPADGRK